MSRWLKDLDRILRGEATRPSALNRGTIEVPVAGLTVVLIALGMVYGACMGSFAAFRGGGDAFWQIVASTLKVPALFVLTLLVTFPSLYVFNALVGSRLAVVSVLRLLVAAMAVTITVLASIGPIVAFFGASTTSYPFMILLNVAVFAVAGLLGMAFLLQTLQRLSLVEPPAPPGLELVGEEKGPPATADVPGALDRVDDRALSRHVKAVFRCWIVLFGVVGAQMGWVLRPFIGHPSARFTWFRARESNVLEGILRAIGGLFS